MPSTQLHQNCRKPPFFALCTSRVGRLTFTPVLSKEQDNCTINVLSRSETCSCWFLFTPNTQQGSLHGMGPSHLIFHINSSLDFSNLLDGDYLFFFPPALAVDLPGPALALVLFAASSDFGSEVFSSFSSFLGNSCLH